MIIDRPPINKCDRCGKEEEGVRGSESPGYPASYAKPIRWGRHEGKDFCENCEKLYIVIMDHFMTGRECHILAKIPGHHIDKSIEIDNTQSYPVED